MGKVPLTLRLPVELLDRLQQAADARGITVHDLILFILRKANQGNAQG